MLNVFQPKEHPGHLGFEVAQDGRSLIELLNRHSVEGLAGVIARWLEPKPEPETKPAEGS